MTLKSVFGFQRSQFVWQRIPDCRSCERRRSFGELGSSAWFNESRRSV